MNKFFQFSEYIKLGKIFNQCTAYLISIEYLDKAIELSSYLPLNKYRLIKAYDLRGNSNMFLGNYQENDPEFNLDVFKMGSKFYIDAGNFDDEAKNAKELRMKIKKYGGNPDRPIFGKIPK